MLFELETEKWIFYRSMLNWLRNRDFFFLVPFLNRYNVSLLFTYWIISYISNVTRKKIYIYIFSEKLENYWALINNLSKPRWGERSIKLSKIQSILSIHRSSTTFERSRKIYPPHPLPPPRSYETLSLFVSNVTLRRERRRPPSLHPRFAHTHTHTHVPRTAFKKLRAGQVGRKVFNRGWNHRFRSFRSHWNSLRNTLPFLVEGAGIGEREREKRK